MKVKFSLTLGALMFLGSWFIGCSSVQTLNSGVSSGTINMAGTRWTYSDEDWTYEMEFLNNGILRTTHPNDKTPDNDFWEQNGNTIRISFNNRYSIYEGHIISDKFIQGLATNINNQRWDFEMKRK
jgi:hypothetical protein